MSLKSILYLSFFLFINTSLFAQSGVYSITEKMSNFQTGGAVFDKVFVTAPNGTVTTYDIPHFTQDVQGHNSQLMTIINNITSLGYKIIESEGWNYPFYVYDTPSSAHYLRTMFLGIPWTTAGLVSAGVNNSLIKITDIFPNPTSNVVNLKFGTSSNNSKLYLIHSGGYIINEFDVSNLTEFSANTSLLSNGNYFFVLVANGIYSESKSLIKQ